MRRYISLILSTIFLLSTMACSDDNITDANNKADEQSEITILIKDYDYYYIDNRYEILRLFAERFEREKGVKVSFDIINGNNSDEYDKKLNTKLYLSDGPTLIFVSEFDTYENLIAQGIALETKSKIKNLEKVYDRLLNDSYFFVPIGMLYMTMPLNRSALDDLEVDEPSLSWTKEDYFEIKEKWYKLHSGYFTQQDYWELMNNFISEIDIINELNKEVDLNNVNVIKYINNMRNEIFSGKYILNKDYTYDNYYKMIFKVESDEYKEAKKLGEYYKNHELINRQNFPNGLKSLFVNTYLEMNNSVVLPNANIVFGDMSFGTWGFLVNRNGKNKELGLEFLNELLSDEIQLEMFFQEYGTYPVSKAIEDEIEKIEKEKNINEKAIALRKFILEKIEEGTYIPYNQKCNAFKEKINNMLEKDLAKFIFADEPYTDEELSQELRKLENKYNMWLKE